MLAITLSLTLKFIPVRGRKDLELHLVIVIHVLKFIPVRGRKHGIALPTLIVVER